MPIHKTICLRTIFTALLIILSTSQNAYAQDYGKLAMLGLSFFAGATIMWCGITWLVYRLTKTLPKKKRVFIVLLVLFFPIIGGMLQTVNTSISRSMNGYMTSPVVEVATEPITLAGAVFQAGSEVRYERTSLISQTPVEATAKEPVPFGSWQINNLVLFGYPERAERVSVSLSQPATIGQWLCRANSLVRFHRDGDDWMLDACTLDADVTIGDITWPAGTDIRRLEESYPPASSTAGDGTLSAIPIAVVLSGGSSCLLPIDG